MKTSSILLSTTAALLLAAQPARAVDPRGLGELVDLPALTGLLRDESSHEPASRSRGRGATRAQGLQLATGLQTSGPLNGSGPAPVATRLNEEDWRKLFVRKTAGK